MDVFLKLSCFFDDSADVGNLISGSSAFSKSCLNIWKFTVYILLKPGLENFEHYFTSMWDECNCVVVWAFFGIAFLWDWNENWHFPVLWLEKNIFMTRDNHDGMITCLEPGILECEVKWALGSITMNKSRGGDGIPVELSNPKRWCCESAALNMPANLENSSVTPGLEKVSFLHYNLDINPLVDV